MAPMLNLEVMCDRCNAHNWNLYQREIKHRNLYIISIIINVYFMLASSNLLKHLDESGVSEFFGFSDKFLSVGNLRVPTSCGVMFI